MFLGMQIYLNHLFDTARYSRDICSIYTGRFLAQTWPNGFGSVDSTTVSVVAALPSTPAMDLCHCGPNCMESLV